MTQDPYLDSGQSASDKKGAQQPLPPFSCTYSPNIPEFLQQINASLAISTYQTGKVILLSPKSRDELVQLPRNFAKPMGIALKENKMGLATRDEVVVLANAPGLAKEYPNQPDTYDAFYTPRSAYYTGEIDLHDLEWTKNGLLGVNTLFSCLCLINEDYNFQPIWKPDFITDIKPQDRCHLNGVALKDGEPKYVTALGQTDTIQGWRENKAKGGILMDVESGEVILEGLAMPHTPKIFNDELYLLISGTGELVKVHPESGKYDIIRELNGFARGMDIVGDYLIIGLSKLRTTSKAFQDLPVSKRSVFAGVVVVYLPSGSVYGYIKYENSVDEIYDVKVLPETIRPGLLNNQRPEFRQAVALPRQQFWAKKRDDSPGAEE